MQGVLEEAIAGVTGAEVPVTGAGRTDAGVHATGQVVHFDTAWRHPIGELQRALNARLPRDVAVRALDEAPAGFHARYSATARLYVYAIHRSSVRSPLWRRATWHVPWALDLDLMADASGRMAGEHDFAAFGRPQMTGGSTVRSVYRCAMREDGDRLFVDVEGNAFLRHQVRRMVGVLVAVGRGKCGPSAVDDMLEGRWIAGFPAPAPPWGLALTAVKYPADDEIARLKLIGKSGIGVDREAF